MTPRRAKYLRNRTRGRVNRSGPGMFLYADYHRRLHTRQEIRLVYVLVKAWCRNVGVLVL